MNGELTQFLRAAVLDEAKRHVGECLAHSTARKVRTRKKQLAVSESVWFKNKEDHEQRGDPAHPHPPWGKRHAGEGRPFQKISAKPARSSRKQE